MFYVYKTLFWIPNWIRKEQMIHLLIWVIQKRDIGWHALSVTLVAHDEGSLSSLRDNYLKLRLWNGFNPNLPANSSPGLSQPVNRIRLKGRQDRPERREVLQPTAILQRKHHFTSNSFVLMSFSLNKGSVNAALMKSCLIHIMQPNL